MITDRERARIYELFRNLAIFEQAMVDHLAQVEMGEAEPIADYMRQYRDHDAPKAMAQPFEEWFASQPKYRAMMGGDASIPFPSAAQRLDRSLGEAR